MAQTALKDGGTLLADNKAVISVAWLETDGRLEKLEESLRLSGVNLQEVGPVEHVCGVKASQKILEELKEKAVEKFGGKLIAAQGKKIAILFRSELVAGGSAELPGQSRWPHYNISAKVFLA